MRFGDAERQAVGKNSGYPREAVEFDGCRDHDLGIVQYRRRRKLFPDCTWLADVGLKVDHRLGWSMRRMEMSRIVDGARPPVERKYGNRSGLSPDSECGTVHSYERWPTGEHGPRRSTLGRDERLCPLTQGIWRVPLRTSHALINWV